MTSPLLSIPADTLHTIADRNEDAYALLDDIYVPDPLGPHEYTPYRYEQVGPYGFLKSFMAPICGYRSCGASRLSAVHLRGV
jgi:hypothetical protein